MRFSKTLIFILAAAWALATPAATQPRVAALPFANDTGEKSLYWLGEAFSIGLTDHLLAAGMDAVELQRRRAAMAEMGLAMDQPVTLASAMLLARRLNVHLAIQGEVHLDRGQRLAISGRILNVATGTLGERVHLEGAVHDLYTLQRDLARALFPALKGQRQETQRAPLAVLQGVPLSAYESYIKGVTVEAAGQRRDFLDRALGIHPLFPGALMERARVDLEEGYPQAAMLKLDRIEIEKMAFPERYWLIRGDAVAAGGDRGSAADMYNRALQHRVFPRAHFRLAAVLAQQGKLMDARRQVDAGLALDPLDPEGIELREALAHREESTS